MTRQEAIRDLEAARMMLIAPNGNPISDLVEALSIAIEALEREEQGNDGRKGIEKAD